MFNKKPNPGTMDTVIGEYTTISGNVETEGSLKLLGKVEGDLKANGDIYLEPSALICGQIHGANVHIGGRVQGDIFAKGTLQLLSTAHVQGNLEVGNLVTDEGAILQGTVRMSESTKSAAKNAGAAMPPPSAKPAPTPSTPPKNGKPALKATKDDD